MIQLPNISVHQINTVTGDIKGNGSKILSLIEQDIDKKVEISVFPETAVTGYMCGALWDNEEFLDDQQQFLNEIQTLLTQKDHKGYVIIGFVRYEGNRKNGYPLLYNSVAVIGQFYWQTYDKRILADADHHEDKKYFANGQETKVFQLYLPESGEIRVGVPICEDIWSIDHIRDIPGEMVKKLGADILISINQSYFYYGKQEKRYNMLKDLSKDLDVPIVYCNSIGLGDIVKNIVIFDGGSMIFTSKSIIYKAKSFEEDSVNMRTDMWGYNSAYTPKKKYEEITNALLFEQKEFFRLNGIEKAQVHVSGGLDSAIVAALVQKAMGVENTIFITNPTNLNSKSIKYVDKLVKALGNKVITDPLQEVFDKFMEVNTRAYGTELSLTAQASVQAVLRTVQGIAASHRYKSGIVATGNHTEIVLGWASFHDIGSIGVHALIGDLTKFELFQLCDYINSELYGKEIIPYDLYNGEFKPSAELPDAKGEDPIDYDIYSGICALLIRERRSVYEISQLWRMANHVEEGQTFAIKKWNKDLFPSHRAILKYSLKEFEAHIIRAQQLMKRSVYKAAQSAPIVIISPRSRGFSNRETLINKY